MSKDAVYALGLCLTFAAAARAQTPVQVTTPKPTQIETRNIIATHTVVAGRTVIQGLFKAPATDNHTNKPGIDCKFRFKADGTFEYTEKTMTATIVTHGNYTFDEGVIDLTPAAANANWPSYWSNPAQLTENSEGALTMKDITYEPSLIGKAFVPGLYRCDKNKNLRYYFNPMGGYKYTGLASSTGEYWVQQTTDTTGKPTPYLILNILRVDGKRVNYHQKLDIDNNGTSFTVDGKYTYRKSAN